MSTLFLVATPIGNLGDMTQRALDVLRDAPVIAAEDTRQARKLLDHFGIKGRVTSYNEHNKIARTSALLEALAAGDVAVVSDAGMPGISDPGHDLVVAALAAGHNVVPVPGASAVLAAVAASGLPSRRFYYLGFLPRTGGQRRTALAQAAACGDTLVLFESPHRVQSTLADALTVLGDRRVAVCRELTKLFEEIWRGPLSGAIARFEAEAPRGEFTIVIEGGVALADQAVEASAGDIASAIDELRATGASAKAGAAAIAARFGIGRREAYRRWVDGSGDGDDAAG